jgi:hypothetical protein
MSYINVVKNHSCQNRLKSSPAALFMVGKKSQCVGR